MSQDIVKQAYLAAAARVLAKPLGGLLRRGAGGAAKRVSGAAGKALTGKALAGEVASSALFSAPGMLGGSARKLKARNLARGLPMARGL